LQNDRGKGQATPLLKGQQAAARLTQTSKPSLPSDVESVCLFEANLQHKHIQGELIILYPIICGDREMQRSTKLLMKRWGESIPALPVRIISLELLFKY